MRNTTRRCGREGFTLIEIAVATAIVGIALAALMVACGSNTRVNDAGRKLQQGIFLAQEIREWTLALPFHDQDPGDLGNPPGPDGSDPQSYVDDLDDLLGVTYTPPRDAQGNTLYDLDGWHQTINLTWRNPNDIGQTVTVGSSDVIHVQVDVTCRGKSIVSSSWLVTREEDE